MKFTEIILENENLPFEKIKIKIKGEKDSILSFSNHFKQRFKEKYKGNLSLENYMDKICDEFAKHMQGKVTPVDNDQESFTLKIYSYYVIITYKVKGTMERVVKTIKTPEEFLKPGLSYKFKGN